MYLTGYPDFTIEKPILALYNPALLAEKQKSKEWYGEIKLKVRRGFITKDYKNEICFYRHTINIPEKNLDLALDRMRAMDIPPKTIFDGGVFVDDIPRLFVFDILVYNGKELLHETCLQRRKLLESLIETDELIWRPLYADFWFKEFQLMLENNSPLVKKAALNYGVPYTKLLDNVEGLVIKNKRSRLKFPKKFAAFSNSFFKLRLDLVRKYSVNDSRLY